MLDSCLIFEIWSAFRFYLIWFCFELNLLTNNFELGCILVLTTSIALIAVTIYIVQLKGKKGDQGEKGPKGDKGEKGEKGTSACQGRHGCQCHSSCQEMITVISFPICLYFFIFSPSFYHLVQSKYLGVRVYVMAFFFFFFGNLVLESCIWVVKCFLSLVLKFRSDRTVQLS